MSLISTYQACKSLLAQHLTSKNETANANEGLTTLIDKVANIQYFDDGIFLCGDKQIAESGDTVNFTALYLEDGKTVSGKKIIFDGLPSRYITTTPEDTSIAMSGDYKIILPDSQDNQQWVSIGSTNKVIIFGYYLGRDSYYMEVDEFPVWITGNSVRVEGSSIYYLDEDGEDAVLDASDYDTTEVLAPFQVGGVILEDIFSDITDSYGVATVTYTGVGTGKLNVQTKTIDGRLQSEIYELIDAIFYDDTSTDQSSSYYINSTGGTNISYSDGYYVLSFGTSATYADLRSITNDVVGKTVNFEVDVVLTGAEVRTRIYNGNTPIKSSEYTTTDGTILLENVEIPSDTTGVAIRLERRNTSTVSSIKFKNWKVYSV